MEFEFFWLFVKVLVWLNLMNIYDIFVICNLVFWWLEEYNDV